MPVTRLRASRTRSCDQVNWTFGPSGMSSSPERSENVSREKNGAVADATRRALPTSSVFWSTMNANSRPAPPPSFVLTGATPDPERSADCPARQSTNSAVTTCLGWPPTVTVKSAAVRPRIGCPCRSTTPTSTVTTSTPLRNAAG